jgi:hypothetical protein
MSSSGSVTPPSNSIVRKLLRLGRFIIFLCTAGWAYPHVCTEDMDLTKIQNDHMAKKT